MAGRYRQDKEKNRSRFYILLSIIFVFVMIKWGVPGLVSMMAGTGGERPSDIEDTIPPQTPIISALPEATNSSQVTVSGYTEGGATLELVLNDVTTINDTAKEDGSFSLPASLKDGTNTILIKAKDQTGNESVSQITSMVFDNKPVEITITSPKDGSEYFGKNNRVVDINGDVSKSNAQLTINNSFVIVSSDGAFTHRYQLADGENQIKVQAIDLAGNSSSKEIKISYTP